MQVTSFLRQHAQALAGASLLLGLGAAANATDTYVGSTDTVTIPSVAVGNYTLSNVTAKVGGIVTLPSGTAPNGAYDTYDPATQQLTSQSVLVGSTTYYNPVVTLTSPVTIGGATGADTYANGQLTIQRLQLGTTVYTGVVVNVVPSDVVGIGGGLPASTADSYSGGVLTLPVLSAFGNIYTNVSLNVTPSEVSVIGSHFTGVLSTGFYTNGTTQTAGTAPGAYGTYQGSGGGAANGSGGGYLDSSPPANPSYEYIYISDTLTNIGGYSYQGVFVQPGSGQVVGTGGFNALNFSLGVNPEWFSNAVAPNFVVLITSVVPGVSTGPSGNPANCNPVVGTVVTALSANSVAYNVPLSSFTDVRQNCGAAVTAAQILAGNIFQVDFQADGGGSAISANGLTSNANLTVPAGTTAPANSPTALYPTTISVAGGISFVTANLPPPPPPPATTNVLSTGFLSTGKTQTSTSATGSWAAYAGSAGSAANGNGGGYIDTQSLAPSASYEYEYISDTLSNIGAYDYEGVSVIASSSQSVSMVGKNNLSATVGVNPEWFANTAGANFVAEITVNVAGVSAGSCNPEIWAVVPATSSPAVPYTIPLSTMAIAQNCGNGAVTLDQILAGNVVQVDFQADGGNSAVTVNGIKSNANLTVPTGATAPSNSPTATYPTSISVVGGVSFVD